MTGQLFQAGVLATSDDDIGKAGPVGLFLILALLIAVFLLGRSMLKHLRRVPLEFPDTSQTGRAPRRPAVPDGVVFEGELLDTPQDAPRARGNGRERPDAPGPDRD